MGNKYNKSVEDTIDYIHKIFRKEELEYIKKEVKLNNYQKKELRDIIHYFKTYKIDNL